ncbi:MAG: flagellar export chaperone FliS [Gammaproteobacteria bacterium]|nr:MAG: flagellar export chaperone FliS [Gammaproteobacteria bacterium]
MDQYRQMGVQSRVDDANPHQLIQMMLDAAVGRVAAARGALLAGETATKGELIGRAIDLVEGLRISLDQKAGGDLSANLFALYDYMARRLLEANLRNDASILDEVASLLRELQDGWRVMGQTLAAEATPA